MSRPERALRRHLKRSGRETSLKLVKPEPVAPRGLVSQFESFTQIARELPPLFERHWQELGDPEVPLDPDWDRYFALEIAGSLKFHTVRFDGALVGYISTVVGPHLHYRSTLFAELEMFWLDPVYRGSWFVMGWFRRNDEMLAAMGVKRVHVAVKSGYKDGRVGLVFRRLGYKLHEQTYSRRLSSA